MLMSFSFPFVVCLNKMDWMHITFLANKAAEKEIFNDINTEKVQGVPPS